MLRGIFEWISNISVIVGIVLLILTYQVQALNPIIPLGYVVIIPASISYYILIFFAIPARTLKARAEVSGIYVYMEKLFQAMPKITMKIECYHYRTVETSERNRVITHVAREEIKYKSWRDISGEFLLDVANAQNDQSYVLLELDTEVKYEKDGTDEDFTQQREEFLSSNRSDEHQTYAEDANIDELEKYSLVKISEEEPYFFNLFWYYVFSLLLLHVIYRLYFFHYCYEQKFKVKKLISTRADLTLSKRFDKLDPDAPRITRRGNTIHFKGMGVRKSRPKPLVDPVESLSGSNCAANVDSIQVTPRDPIAPLIHENNNHNNSAINNTNNGNNTTIIATAIIQKNHIVEISENSSRSEAEKMKIQQVTPETTCSPANY